MRKIPPKFHNSRRRNVGQGTGSNRETPDRSALLSVGPKEPRNKGAYARKRCVNPVNLRRWVSDTRRRIYNQCVQPEQSSSIILAQNLTKVYRSGRVEVPAVRGVSFAVQPGEFVAIVGPSGSGKSTLFYLLGGLTQATHGRVEIGGVDFATLNDGERTRLRKQRIGFVFQKFNLLPTLSAMGNIEIAYAVSGRKEPLDRVYLDHLSDMLSIRGRLKHRPSELSGGEQQRVAIARALVTRPAIVLADEPTGNLDTKNSDAVLAMLQRSNQELGQTTLMITHNPEAASIASRILYMRDGEIVREEKGAESTPSAVHESNAPAAV
jgi:putative ABC transport system ATP-binding protein